MLYGGSYSVGEQYAGVVNKFKEALGSDVNVYTMIIPTSCEFYSPESVKAYCGSQKDNIDYVYSMLKNTTGVDAYSALKKHVREDIYLRTDHHWAPLGAYYAAQAPFSIRCLASGSRPNWMQVAKQPGLATCFAVQVARRFSSGRP